ncbi:MAG: DUF2062 domain-containing protein [Candidatus Omnitrophica bacterium]|nr:DUF2062 domain-containing protein [Candidatus Omnitrophota bacterium]
MTQNDSDKNKIWCIIPVYNNGRTLHDVVLGCKNQIENIVVVDDGSTDIDVRLKVADDRVVVLRHATNQGKGSALMTGLRYVRKHGGKYAITIDADGQHFPQDISKFISEVKGKDDLIVIGARDFSVENVPGKSKFGRNFANFWFKVETGLLIRDCQSGYRAYPVDHVLQLGIKGKHYNFETEVITKAAWAGLRLKTINVGVKYDKGNARVSHFHAWKDNLRISKTHTFLVLRRLFPLPHKKLIARKEDIIYQELFKHPVKILKHLLKENTTPEGLAASAAVGILLAVLPLIAMHTIAIIYVTTRLHLNKIMAVSIQNLCIPPFVPALCIEIGHYIRYGEWLTEVSIDVIFYQALDRIWEWFLGSLIVAPVLAILTGGIVFIIAKFLQRKTRKDIVSA